jgi:hypothetical protein
MPLTLASKRSRRIALLIAVLGGLLAVAARAYYVLHAQVLQPLDYPNVRADAADYYRYAWNLAHHATFSSDVPGSTNIRPDSFRDPGYAVFLAGWMLVTSNYDSWYAAILLTQALLGGLTVSLLALAARDRLAPAPLGVATFVMAVWPHSVAMTSFVLSETLLGFMCALGLYCVHVTLARPTSRRLAVTGLVFGAAALTNAVLIPFGTILALALGLRRHLDWRAAAVVVFASLVMPALWGVRAFTIPSSETSTHRAIINLVEGSWPTYHEAYQLAMAGDEDGIRTIRAIDDEIAIFQKDRYLGVSALANRMGGVPTAYVRWYASKPALLWDWDIRIGQGDVYVYPTRHSPFREQSSWKLIETICFLANPLVMLLAFSGAVIAAIRRDAPSFDIALATLATLITLAYSILQAEPRYSIAFRGAEVLLAAVAVSEIIRRISDRKANPETGVAVSSS